jgi:hypothetical protein
VPGVTISHEGRVKEDIGRLRRMAAEARYAGDRLEAERLERHADQLAQTTFGQLALEARRAKKRIAKRAQGSLFAPPGAEHTGP